MALFQGSGRKPASYSLHQTGLVWEKKPVPFFRVRQGLPALRLKPRRGRTESGAEKGEKKAVLALFEEQGIEHHRGHPQRGRTESGQSLPKRRREKEAVLVARTRGKRRGETPRKNGSRL